jgi:Protein of unknown function (DUF2523)
MYGILISAFNTILGFLLKKVIVQFFVLFALYFVIQTFVTVLGSFIPKPSDITGGLSSIASGTWYFMDLFAFSQGASLVVSAMVSKFLIRRIPLIG